MLRYVWFLIPSLIFAAPAFAESRVALVIGNGAYQNAPALLNPSNDAKDVAAALKRSGFTTIFGSDMNKAAMEEAEIQFARAARTADVALFYYSGHAIQFAGVNYLAPIDIKLTDEADLRRMMRLDDIVNDIGQARNLRILVLDACRDNPLADELKRTIGPSRALALQRGLAKIDSPQGMIVAYATQAGRTAEDGSGRNSPYTASFLSHIEEQEEIGTVFRRVSSDVYESTKHSQLPELSLSLIGEFYLRGKLEIAVTPPTPPMNSSPAPQPSPCTEAADHWKSTEAIGTKSAFEDHVARFPDCPFAGLAKAKIAALAAPPPADIQRFDGIWAGALVCESTPELPGWKTALVGTVRNGNFHGQIGREGKPGSQTFDGMIEADGTAEILQRGLSGKRDPFHRPLGTEYRNTYLTKFDGSQGTGTRSNRSSCNVIFTKR